MPPPPGDDRLRWLEHRDGGARRYTFDVRVRIRHIETLMEELDSEITMKGVENFVDSIS